jgi:hypothetical protein
MDQAPGWCRICGIELPVGHVFCTRAHAQQWHGYTSDDDDEEIEWWQR